MLLYPLVLFAATGPAAWGQVQGESVDFSRDVLPILIDRCFACHGPDAGSRKAGLRLDTRDGALGERDGTYAVIPGDLGASELWSRVTSEFEFELMPPPESHLEPLDEDELGALRAWIEGGAPWAEHWSFVSPVKVATSGEAHPLDELIGRRLAEEGLGFAREAETHTLARRLSFDLVGLPPSSAALELLGEEPSQGDWTFYVSSLLASPHYGERMAMWWLDGARYADSDGFQEDAVRTNWPWRDWVVRAFQDGMSFDQFIREQIAGDVMPGATQDQILATCFSRNHMHNGEGGRDPAESRVDYVRDRTNTVGTVLLGLTLECAQCHDHKFDPISQRDYYSLSAFFDSIDEDGRAGRAAGPFLKRTFPAAQPHLERAQQEWSRAQADEAALRAAFVADFDQWLTEQRQAGVGEGSTPLRGWTPLIAAQVHSTGGSTLTAEEGGVVLCRSSDVPQDDYRVTLDTSSLTRITGLKLDVLRSGDGPMSFSADGEFIVTGVKLRRSPGGGQSTLDVELVGAVAGTVGEGVDKQYGAPKGVLDDDPRTGWTTRGKVAETETSLVLRLGEPLDVAPDEALTVDILHRSTVPGAQLRRFRLSTTDQRGPILTDTGPAPFDELQALGSESEVVDPLRERLLGQYLEELEPWQAQRARSRRFREQLDEAKVAAGELSVTVLAERDEPRVTSILERGIWDQRGDSVERAFPRAIPGFPAPDGATRLDLANWITHPRNPLTARAIVNQVWQNLFGRGLVGTPGDLGLQGERPRYPEVLDWLAVDFMASGWDMRHLLRTITASRVYRQSSALSKELLERDPRNEFLARGARFRLPAWMIRDAALHASGLLDPGVGGPPMYPHQPEGVWEDVFNGRFRYKPTLGAARHRRTLYAFWRRNAAPTYLFDSADRRTCSVALRSTNTPLQALTLLNDVTLLEAALALAGNAWSASPNDPRSAILAMGEAVLQRTLTSAEADIATGVFDAALGDFQGETAEAVALLRSVEFNLIRELPMIISSDGAETLAALTVVANLVLNLDEAVTHE